jgi:hypothetical protein
MDPDTLNPRAVKPDYITQTGRNGKFLLQHLAFGLYRIIAVRDQFRNLLYDPEADDYGVMARDVNLFAEDSTETGIAIQLAKEDTTPPRLLSVNADDVNHLNMEFSEPLDTSALSPVVVSILDTVTRKELHVISIYPNPLKPVSYTVVTARQDSTQTYALTVQQAHDRVGIPISQIANSLTFSGSPKPDSLGPKIVSVSISDSARGIPLKPVVIVQFSDAVDRRTFDNAISLSDTSGGIIPSLVEWGSDAVLLIAPQNLLASNAWYRLAIVTGTATDWSGRLFRDSVRVVHFETLDQEALSSIEGVVVDREAAGSKGPIVVIADAVNVKTSVAYSSIAGTDGSFAILGLEEGRYVVHAFRDRNSNGILDCGKPYPFVRSERFNYAPDTLKVRARWPLEGIRIELR